ncbi:MAG: DUF2142 domain-containing protein [Frankiaceae bacterium]|nr:DUF2142 domain-containing protein [Frankiaceae bacterium]
MSAAAGWSWRTFWVSLVLLSTLLALWGLATPRFAVPDEPAHFLKAAGVARGQLVGPADRPTVVEVPPALESTRQQTGCFAFQPAVSADCAPGYTGDDGPDLVAYTQAGRYPPGYYALVGLPTLVWTDLDVLYAVRGLSAALCAALLAAALTAAAATGRRLLTTSVGVSVTPMALFLCSGVNPSGPEIAAALALWTAGVALVLDGGPPPRPLLATAGVAGVVLALSRPISPFWLALIGLTLLVLAGRRRIVELVRRRGVQVWLGALVLAAAAQSAWVLGVGSLELYGGTQELSLAQRLEGSVDRTDERLHQVVGWFGWLDTPAPTGVVLAWATALAVVVCLGLRRPAPLRVVLVVLLAVGCVLVPVALEVPSVNQVGFYWQGRYTLPLAVGLPVLAAVASRRPVAVPRSVLAVVLGAVGVAQVVCFVVVLGRYTVGSGNGLGLRDAAWPPPLPALVLAVAFSVAAAAWSIWLLLLPPADRRGGQVVVEAKHAADLAA